MNYDDTICGRCGGDNLADYPVCRVCAVALHFPHRAICLHCETKRQPVMNSNLWLNEYDPNLEAIAVYADASHDECEGMGIVRECGEWAFCSCTNAALLAAADEPEFANIALSLVPKPGYRNAHEFFTREQEPLMLAA